MPLKPLPPYVWLDNAYWQATERNLFGYGYYKLTSNLRLHPKGNFITSQQMKSYLLTNKAMVVVGAPVKNAQIVDAIPYEQAYGQV